jgi:membrane protein insertase Oxa1/YidC/SpoIIIJ
LVTYINARLDSTTTEYVIKADKVKANADMNAAIQEMLTNGLAEDEDAALKNYFVGKAQEAVKVAYEDEENGVVSKTKFIWIKNIWMTDASYKHPVQNYADFEAEAKNEEFSVAGEDVSYSYIRDKGRTEVYTEDTYNLITEKLTVQKEAANGYYILIALSIGTILLQQFVMMRSQKEQQKYSTVDGQGASQQKMMMFIMTGMFAIFSFMYSAAFSIYMITSNVFSMLSTLIINKFVDKKLAKEEASATVVRMDNRTLSRIEAAKNAGKASAQDTREKKEKEDKE